MDSRDAEQLKVFLGHVGLFDQKSIDHADSDIQSFWLHLELIVHFDQIIDQVGSFLAIYLRLVLHEIRRIFQSLFFFKKMFVDLRSELSN